MVQVGTLLVNRASEPFESIAEIASEPDRDVRRSERGDDFEAGGLECGNQIDPE